MSSRPIPADEPAAFATLSIVRNDNNDAAPGRPAVLPDDVTAVTEAV